MILREPVDRLGPHIRFQRSLGKLTGIKSFEDHIAACRIRDVKDTTSCEKPFNGLSIGMYGEYSSIGSAGLRAT
jgi:hypothetical protein